MFDDLNRVPLTAAEDELMTWTADDDAMVAALTAQAFRSEWGSFETTGDAGSHPGAVLVAELRAQARAVAFHQARLMESIMAIVDEYGAMEGAEVELAWEGAVSEVRAALSLTRRAAESDVGLAWDLRERLPDVLAALREGRIDYRRACVFVRGTAHLCDEEAQAVASRALNQAEGRTTGQLRALIRRLCMEVDPAEAVRRYEEALADRKVVADPTESGTAKLTASDLPPDRVSAVMDKITRIAQSLRAAGEERTVDQLRADVFLDLLEGGQAHRVLGTIDVRVDLATLARLDENPAELEGFGPVVADIARQMTERHGPQWRFTVTDGAGLAVQSGTTRRRPNAQERRMVESRDVTCVFPGCRMPAIQCDLDHRTRVADGGETHEGQLVALCRHDHVVRHRHGWTHRRNDDGSHVWISPLGVRYTRPPPM